MTGIILIALITTYRLNFISSVLYLDPRHMFHSYPQHLFLVSTYVNILMVYSFNNWHDGSSGTKGSDKLDALPSTDLTRGDGNEASVEEIEKEKVKEDIDTQFERTVWRALALMEEFQDDAVEPKDAEDSCKSFCTRLVVSWLFSNILLIAVITSNEFSMLNVNVSSMPQLQSILP